MTLIANQPATRLHSQLDFGAYSQSKKIAGREVVRLNPADAARRGIADGDIVRLFNDRGACLAAAAVTDDVMPGVLQLSTGAWYDPEPGAAEQPLCVHGNPNVLTRDVGTSRLAQGCCGQVTVVECEKYSGIAAVTSAPSILLIRIEPGSEVGGATAGIDANPLARPAKFGQS